MVDDPSLWSISRVQRAYRTKELSPVELTQAMLDRIARLDPELRTYITTSPEIALQQAQACENDFVAGRYRGPLHGIPISFKDLIDVEGLATTGSSQVNRYSEPARRDAGCVSSLRAAGAVFLGKSTAYEFGFGLPQAGDWPAPSRNPWDLNRIPGGSSSGSAVQVFAGLSFGSFGTDTGGSIRGPASYCGVVGLKPSRGAISTEGVMPLSQSLDYVGPIGRSAHDVELLLTGSSGKQPADRAELPDRPLIGVPTSQIENAKFGTGVVEALDTVIDTLAANGCIVVDVELPPIDETEQALLTIIGFEGRFNHRETLADKADSYGASARERLLAGGKYTEDDLGRAHRVRDKATAFMSTVFKEVEFIVSPVTHTTAPTFMEYAAQPTPRTLFTGIYNLSGSPALSMPIGHGPNRMPIGLQVAGSYDKDREILRFAEYIESLVGFPMHLTDDAARFRPDLLGHLSGMAS